MRTGTTLLASILILTTATLLPASPSLTPETVVHAQFNDAIGLVAYYGRDDYSKLHFSYLLDTSTGDFSYSTLPSQTILGHSVSLSTVGTYDGVDTFNYTGTGSIDGDVWSSTGSTVWVGDPTATIDQDVTINGHPFHIHGTMTIDNSGNSNASYTVTGAGISADITANVTDFVAGNNWTVGGFLPNGPDIKGKFDTNIPAPNQMQGLSVFELPEPGAVSIIAVAGLATLRRSRRRQN